MKERKIICPLALLLAGLSLQVQAQDDLNPTVEVTRIFQAKLKESFKPVVPISVPDSVLHFNMDFDYSVFDRPFTGSSYTFRPYEVSMTPEPDAWQGKRFWLKAGAGYSFHPELDFVWEPGLSGKFRLSFYGGHHGYFGQYRRLGLDKKANDLYRLGREGDRVAGFDYANRFGVSGRLDAERSALTFDVAYRGLGTKDAYAAQNYNGLALNARYFSQDERSSYFFYDAGVRLRLGSEDFGLRGDNPWFRLGNTEFGFKGSFGPVLGEDHHLLVDVSFDLASYGGKMRSHVGNFYALPKYVYDSNRFHLVGGVKVSFNFCENERVYGAKKSHRDFGQLLYPVADLGYDLIERHMNLYLHVDGGDDINALSGMLEENRHFSPLLCHMRQPVFETSTERIQVGLGVRGQFWSAFRYDLRGGFYVREKDPVAALYVDHADLAGQPVGLLPAVNYKSLRCAFFRVKAGWESERISAEGRIGLCTTDFNPKSDWGFAPAPMQGGFRFGYNWARRIWGGLSAEFATRRKGMAQCLADNTLSWQVKVPGYFDLGLEGRYRMSSSFSLWGRAGNLLNANIQRIPGYVESGIYFTAGIMLDLQ